MQPLLILFWTGLALALLGTVVILFSLGKNKQEKALPTGWGLLMLGLMLAVVAAVVGSVVG